SAMLARYMDESRSIPTATSFRTITVTTLDGRRKQLKEAGKRVSFTHLIAYAVARAATEQMPVMARSFQELDGKPHVVDPGLGNIGAMIGAEKVMTMTSTYDHRIIQGAESGQFLQVVEAYLQGDHGFYEQVFKDLGAPVGDVPQPPAPAAAAATERAAAPARVKEPPDEAILQAVQAAVSLLKAHRMHGHLAARLDPLGSEPEGDPALDPEPLGLTPELMAKIPAKILRMYVPGATLADALPHLRETYCGTIAYEIEHIASHRQRV